MPFTPERRRANPDTTWTGTERRKGEPNRDPITGAPGAHPVGTGLGAAAGGINDQMRSTDAVRPRFS